MAGDTVAGALTQQQRITLKGSTAIVTEFFGACGRSPGWSGLSRACVFLAPSADAGAVRARRVNAVYPADRAACASHAGYAVNRHASRRRAAGLKAPPVCDGDAVAFLTGVWETLTACT